jgi:hypothetical protein
MNRSTFLAVLTCIGLCAPPLFAEDLSRIDRNIGKEPAYKSKPKYCLLVFGRAARTRVWLVLDGDTLYVDRNANGDLTEEGEKVIDKSGTGSEENGYGFEVGRITAEGRMHERLMVSVSKLDRLAAADEAAKEFLSRNPGAHGYILSVEMEMPGWKGSGLGGRVQQFVLGADVNGVLQFGDRPQDAPVIHFGGPWQATLYGRQQLMRGRDTELFVAVGTAGIGPGTTAYLAHAGVVPENARPSVEVSYAPNKPGETPLRERYELKHRC